MVGVIRPRALQRSHNGCSALYALRSFRHAGESRNGSRSRCLSYCRWLTRRQVMQEPCVKVRQRGQRRVGADAMGAVGLFSCLLVRHQDGSRLKLLAKLRGLLKGASLHAFGFGDIGHELGPAALDPLGDDRPEWVVVAELDGLKRSLDSAAELFAGVGLHGCVPISGLTATRGGVIGVHTGFAYTTVQLCIGLI